MNSLVQLTIGAHGGFERWQRFEHVSAHLRTGGILWALKHQPGVLDDVNVRVALRREWASHAPFVKPHLRTSFEPNRVAIETTDGRVVEERLMPRDSFAGHALDTPWDQLQLAYFAGYAMWTYLTTPFVFAMDGVATEELDPWRENGESWQRLKVTFPSHVATHSTVQTFYFDAEASCGAMTTMPMSSVELPRRTTCTTIGSSQGSWSRPPAECSDAGRTERSSRSPPS
jgi:hypothetical protein